ncbi:MAG: rRNA maturation RNase YbeY [Planctomycetota bacterium]
MDDPEPSRSTTGQPPSESMKPAACAVGAAGGDDAAVPPGRVMSIDLVDRTGRLTPSQIDELGRYVEDATAELGISGTLDVAVIDDSRMAAAHERYSGVSGTTDVLTFDHRADATSGRRGAVSRSVETELLVCFDEATRQASANGTSVVSELLLYVVHGVLHCVGYDDATPAAAAAMHAEEDRVLVGIGVGPVYAGGRS